MAVLDIQRKGQQIGRLRMGVKVATSKKDKSGNVIMRPSRLDTWRITTGSAYRADAIVERFGGEVKPWEREFEVITDTDRLPVTVPPRDEVVSQWYEMWNKGGCMRRCDSQRERISGGSCLCVHAEDPGDAEEIAAVALERARLASLNPPQACKLITRINVMIPDLPGLGVFRLDTHSYYAAVEIGDTARLMQVARDQGVFLPAELRIEQRQRVAGGQTKLFPVPALELLATFRDLATGAIKAGGITAQLPPAPGEKLRAITAAAPGPAADPVPDQAVFDRMEPEQQAQAIANAAAKAVTRLQIEQLDQMSEAHGLGDDQVCVDREEDFWEELRSYLRGRWRALPAAVAS